MAGTWMTEYRMGLKSQGSEESRRRRSLDVRLHRRTWVRRPGPDRWYSLIHALFWSVSTIFLLVGYCSGRVRMRPERIFIQCMGLVIT